MPAKKQPSKYIFIFGGVMSGVGKGVTTASIGTILQARGINVSLIKIDPYLNVDAGTMNPTEHGEVFVLDSGMECDQDMGNYERFLNKSLPEENYMTNGMIYKYVIDKERALGYGGKCVDPVPYVTEEILRRIDESVKITDAEITVIEIGGTVGEYQNALFVEAVRRLKLKRPRDVMVILVSYLPVPGVLGEMKTKPTQNAVRQLNSYGVSPDIVIARSSRPLDEKRKEKIARSSGIEVRDVVSAPDIKSIYDVPLNFEKDRLSDRILEEFGLRKRVRDLSKWQAFVKKINDAEEEVSIAIVGKYFDTGDFILSDSYISVIEAIKCSCASLGVKPNIEWLNSKDYESGRRILNRLTSFGGVIVPGGFGETGIEGKINVIRYLRERKIPFLGLCYGMQLAIVEYARNVLNMNGAHTVEINPQTPHPVIDVMPEQKVMLEGSDYGGTMRLGGYPANLVRGTIAREAYKKDRISERHRHRYEVSPDYINRLKEGGLVFSGVSPDGRLMEIAELPRKIHPFFLGTQFHPEFKARPLNPHPLFTEFIKAAVN